MRIIISGEKGKERSLGEGAKKLLEVNIRGQSKKVRDEVKMKKEM